MGRKSKPKDTGRDVRLVAYVDRELAAEIAAYGRRVDISSLSDVLRRLIKEGLRAQEASK